MFCKIASPPGARGRSRIYGNSSEFSGVTELPFDTFVLLMQPIHLAIGIVEGLATSAVVIFVRKARPEIIKPESASEPVAKLSLRKVAIGFLAAAVVTGWVLSWLYAKEPL